MAYEKKFKFNDAITFTLKTLMYLFPLIIQKKFKQEKEDEFQEKLWKFRSNF